MSRLAALLCVPLAGACILTIDDDEDGTPAGQPYCGDGTIDSNEQCDDGNTIAGDGCTLCARDSGDAFLTATWQLRNIATSTTTACPTGFDTVAVYQQRLDANDLAIGAPIIDLFDCVSLGGTSAPLVAARYQVWMEVTDATNANVYAQSTSATVDLSMSDKSIAFQILNDGGYFGLAWNLVGGTSGSSLTCAQAGAVGGVDVVATDIASSTNTNADVFDCEDYSGITAGYRTATYTISVSALNVSDQSIGTAPALTNKVIGTHNTVTNLGTVTIPIDGQ